MKPTLASTGRRPITSEQTKDMGLVIVLLLTLGFLHSGNRLFLQLALVAIAIVLIVPVLFKPVDCLWYFFSELLGTVMSRVVLTLVFFLVITPIGFLKRIVSRKRMLTEEWKKGRETVFTVRDKVFSGSDISKPF
jgi:hypothetical protein